MMYSSANFDETVFTQPMEFDIHRAKPTPWVWLWYSLMPGANLARLETRIFFEEFLSDTKVFLRW